MKNNNQPKQVSLAGVAQNKGDKQPKRKHRFLLWLIPLVAVALLIGGTTLYKQLTKGPSLSAREMVNYTVTEEALAGKVSYFALGVLGEEATDPMDMVAVLCFDRKKGTASVLQMPVATYLGKESGFATSVIGEVWGNPQPVVWCETCRCAVKAKDVDGDKHKPCGTKLTTRKGSAFGDLCRVFNDQYGLPIDNYLVIPREGLIGLIDAVGGLDIKLEKDMTLGDTPYKKGVQLLSGKAAVDYAMQHEYKNTPATDRTRMTRQRAVISAMLERLARYKINELYYVDKNTGSSKGPIGQLMVGANPLRFDTSSFGKARLANCPELTAADKKTSRALAEFVADIAKLPQEKITFSILPGESVKQGTSSVWSVNREAVIRLLNEQMNPYGLTLDDKTVTAPQVKDKAAKSDASTITLNEVAVSQGTTTTTAATTAATTTTTVAGG
ncbi:MAG: LCP family protein [Clostridia bacterium]|nr:LCP family protein [Clostridia bacterium]